MPPLIFHRNRTVRIDTSGVVENALSESFLTADIAAASGTLTVANIEKFAIGKYVWINPFSERSEIIAVHASTAPSGSTITLAANTVYAHYTGEPVYYVEFNQVEVSEASTATGSKSVLATVALEAGKRETVYLDTSITSGYYFARYKDSVAGTFGSYSDACIYGGFAANTVGYMIDRALRDLQLTLSDVVTTQDCYEWLNDGIRDIQGKLKRWPDFYSYNAIVGQVSRGVNTITLPTDMYDKNTNKSVIAFRIGTDKNLTYLSPGDFDNQMNTSSGNGVAHTTVRTQATAGDTSLAITNSYDFADSGSVDVYVSGTLYNITYTGVTRDTSTGGTGALTGVPASGTGSITVTIPAATDVWQNEIEGRPLFYTVRGGSFEFYPLADATYDNTNAYSDYGKVCTAVDSESDTIDFQRYDILQAYLTWKIETKAKKNGVPEMGMYYRGRFIPTGYYAMFTDRLNDAIKTLGSPNTFKINPGINRINTRRTQPAKADVQNLNISDQ